MLALAAFFWLSGSMLELQDITLFVKDGDEITPLLSDITTSFPRKHFAAVIGPSGCGKSTLLKTLVGIAPGEEEGELYWCGRDLLRGTDDLAAHEVAYVPQFGIAHEELTARECVEYALRLRVAGISSVDIDERVEKILAEVTMQEFAERRVSLLSGGQRRRLALAQEIVSNPAIMLADEVTTGLDPESEDEIVHLLRDLSRNEDRLVISVTHSLAHLALYDSVLVLVGGALAYHGPAEFLAHYFQCADDPQKIFKVLETREPADWSRSWKKHRKAVLDAAAQLSPAAETSDTHEANTAPAQEVVAEASEKSVDADEAANASDAPETPIAPAATSNIIEIKVEPVETLTPSVVSQFLTLFERRLKIFSRDKAQLLLQAGLILGFPLVVAIFAWGGLPAIQNLSMENAADLLKQMSEAIPFIKKSAEIGGLVSGIVMFQVILLTLMGANNSGREIASERLIFEKEKLAGLAPTAYIASKAAFLSILVLLQSLWMGIFVHYACVFPGNLVQQLLFLILANAAMTSVCLAISSFAKNAEQASLASIYLVGFQLPLSGAVLALPVAIGTFTRPLIAAYWSWSGTLETLKAERYYDIVQSVAQTALSPGGLCLLVLLCHVLLGLVAALIGAKRLRLQ